MSRILNTTLAALLVASATPALAADLPPFAGNFDDAQYGYANDPATPAAAPRGATLAASSKDREASATPKHEHRAGSMKSDCTCHG
ncbi:hypothetical protein [Anaeromyxobacter paludicola]|uniref:Uncharacterized protein n=1 Tax=Anaeromyxobacter paludicola TaxID=2918171 RepID=A0ABN6NA24_9BACT|nr:hypothetical protein [Anaeromyxobacter paludicola]BDG10074.1 hypothetical protein AMPC_31870 [Anaeromyxobacter paludicola]